MLHGIFHLPKRFGHQEEEVDVFTSRQAGRMRRSIHNHAKSHKERTASSSTKSPAAPYRNAGPKKKYHCNSFGIRN